VTRRNFRDPYKQTDIMRRMGLDDNT
jgi:hypothetical protein